MKTSILPVCPAVLKIAALALVSLTPAMVLAEDTNTIFPLQKPSVSTVPSNGDVNPYGVAIVPKNIDSGEGLKPGDILVSNFNNASNLQGRGTTILRVSATGQTSTFFTSSQAKTGLSAALGILSNGVVLIGNTPTADGTPATLGPGTLSVLDSHGDFLGTFGTSQTVNGPWGMAVYDKGSNGAGSAHVFVSNVEIGTVVRFDITYSLTSVTAGVLTLSTGFSHRLDPAAIVLGPSGLVYNAATDTLYVASSSDNAIYEIPNAATASGPVSSNLLIQDNTHLHGPLDLSILPNGHLLVANSDGSNVDPNQPSELVEYTLAGTFVGQMSIDATAGGAFGLATSNVGWGTFRLAAVDDVTNTLNMWTVVAQ